MTVPIREVIITSYVPFALAITYAAFFVSGMIMLYGLYRHLKSYGIGLREFFGLVLRISEPN